MHCSKAKMMDISSINVAPLAIVMVGLPARGKTYIAKKLTRYLNWVGFDTKVFNVGEYRREAVSQTMSNADFFNPNNADARTIREEVKVSSPDYQNTNKEEAIEDFKRRISHYESQYEPLDDNLDRHLSFIKIFNQGEKYLANRVQGHIESRVVYYLMNIHVLPRTIYITRHGEAEMNISGQIGNDCDLTEQGHQFAHHLGNFIAKEMGSRKKLRVWTSMMRQTIQTAVQVDGFVEHWKALNEIDAVRLLFYWVFLFR
ncbi:hypothetical protein HELRODRAFT_189517 [Helobdella robusta]|uniref:6-phosphofructo-2-kinase domain-containing protein n=1 Tax=Helobdella robusta TaxID=6412 RepID=T1FR44_HELRO|nr:hypothetical protein HELRODRAFT_189517 [Helobdella robusta]ESN92590.1 hypothetical protein HELRODRAFT_189517 [Helobdella robusta]